MKWVGEGGLSKRLGGVLWNSDFEKTFREAISGSFLEKRFKEAIWRSDWGTASK